MAAARALTLVLALVVSAWFVIGIRQARNATSAAAILSRPGTIAASQARQADRLLRAAGGLNPDSQVDVLRARAALFEHDRARAVRILQAAVRREPMNLQAWLALAEASRNVGVITRAVGNVSRLDPMLARAR